MTEASTRAAPRAAARESDVDVVVVGAGLSGLACALGAALRGLQISLLESAGQVGGAAAYSGGQVWVGANHVALTAGFDDDLDATEAYVRAIAHEHPELLDEAMRRWLRAAPDAMRHGEEVGAIGWVPIPGFADYHQDAPGRAGRTAATAPAPASTAHDLASLATLLGLPPAALEETACRFNEHTDAGVDPDFGRGTNPFVRRYTAIRSTPRTRSSARSRSRRYTACGYACSGPGSARAASTRTRTGGCSTPSGGRCPTFSRSVRARPLRARGPGTTAASRSGAGSQLAYLVARHVRSSRAEGG